MKIVAVLVTEGVQPGPRGLDVKGMLTHLCAPAPLVIDSLHATVLVDLNPQDSGPMFPVHIRIRDPYGLVIAHSETRIGFAQGIQGAPIVVSFPLGTLLLDTHGPHVVEATILHATGEAAFNFQNDCE